jgi:hypothetical protein
MKKSTLMILALAAGAVVNAETTKNAASAASAAAQKPQVCTSTSKACELTADEKAFSAKLSDENRKLFAEELTTEQRKAAMESTQNGGNANDAVRQLARHVANAEKPASQAKTAQAK